MKNLLWQAIFTSSTFGFVYFWEQSKFAQLTVPLIGLISLLYILFSFQQKSMTEQSKTSKKQVFATMLIITTTLLLVTMTGGLNSILFFLFYFICFNVAFMLEPETSFIFCAGVCLLFFPDMLKDNTLVNGTKLLSLLLLCPLAYFFGKEVKKSKQREEQTEILEEKVAFATERITDDVAELIKNESTVLQEEDLKKLKDIVDTSKSLTDEK